MEFGSLSELTSKGAAALAKGPVCVILAEDDTALDATIQHHCNAGFETLLLALPSGVAAPTDLPDNVHQVHTSERTSAFTTDVVNTVIALLKPGTWLSYVYNAEFLFTPFSEHRSVGEALHFCTEERRASILCFVVDLYAADFNRSPSGVDLEDAYLDNKGYYALERRRDGEIMERQLNFHGGLRWRFEEHIAKDRNRIDRAALFRTAPGLQLRPDHTLSDEELNTYECPWHNSMTASITSFRAAKALASNPGSRAMINSFWWHNSQRFEWRAQQLMDMGLMEPGQWF